LPWAESHTSHGVSTQRMQRAVPQGAKVTASRLLAGAKARPDNAFKALLVERTLGAVMAEARKT